MLRNTLHLTCLAIVAAVLLCTVPVFAETACNGPEVADEVELTPELAAEVGLPAAVEVQTKEPTPCLAKETYHVCEIKDPCTGQILRDATCCPPGTVGGCFIGITPDRCYTSVTAICLGIL